MAARRATRPGCGEARPTAAPRRPPADRRASWSSSRWPARWTTCDSQQGALEGRHEGFGAGGDEQDVAALDHALPRPDRLGGAVDLHHAGAAVQGDGGVCVPVRRVDQGVIEGLRAAEDPGQHDAVVVSVGFLAEHDDVELRAAAPARGRPRPPGPRPCRCPPPPACASPSRDEVLPLPWPEPSPDPCYGPPRPRVAGPRGPPNPPLQWARMARSSSATMLVILMAGFTAGPAVSL